jgi:DNA-binding beta-propeller fold protein YncE
MRAVHALLVLAGALGAMLCGASCTERPHNNPFDPANPTTGGRPSGFAALAGDGRVTLEWQTASAPGLIGYQVFRSLDPATGFGAISNVLPPRTSTLPDFGLLNGVDHYYRLYFVFDRGRGGSYASDVATPGPVTPWIADDGVPALERLTADGRHVAGRVAGAVTSSATDVDVDFATGAVWTCDRGQGVVTIYQPAKSQVPVAVSGFSDPVAVAVDPLNHSAWVGDNADHDVFHLDANGKFIPAETVSSVDGPIGIAVDPVDESVWICERNGSRVRHVDLTGLPVATAFVVNPSRVAVDSVTQEAWVTCFSRGRVLRLSPGGVRMDSVSSIPGPLGIVVDARRGRIWVTDPVAGHVVKFHRDGTTDFVVGALPGASDIALDPATGEVWVTAQDAGQVVRIAPDGTILTKLGGFDSPAGIALDPGTGAGPRPAAAPAHPRR